MLGTIVNVSTIVVGSIIGTLISRGIKDNYKNTIMDGISLCVLIIGIISGIKTENIILAIGSIVLGSLIGERISIEKRLDRLGQKMEKRLGDDRGDFAKGFVTASLVYCIGAMAIVGSLESGLTGNHETLFAKSILDGITAIIFSSTFGIGVAFSALPVLIYQGSITLLASLVKDILTAQIINEMSAVGGILIMAIGINTLGIKKIKVGNMLPAIFLPIIYYIIMDLLVFIR
ncbi:MAG TPA: DUF554 domain-containing protein [Tissierellaceae bacterium]|nr:DUF554 domain-containing protein [Tissierellaceae bacterium]